MSIRILLTGGTIDKLYSVDAGELIFEETHIEEMLDRANVTADIVIEELMLKDSLDIDDSDREQILDACEACEEESILITHGTDTMVETAELLGEAGLDKSIVLTGAMIPYSVRDSDALFNLGFALAAVQLAPGGVYVAMNGELFDWDDVRKNYEEGCFESLSDD
ncbi:MAG: asparaginase domain-containing protein [Gammaproteobacteria bacterium]|jgi:L-asparaginase